MTHIEETTSQNATGSLRSKVVRGVKWQVASQFATQSLRVATNLVLTRLLVREAFGLMGMVQVFIVSVELLSDIGLRGSVIHHKRGTEAKFLNTVWTIKVIRGALLWLITCLLAYPFAQLYEMPELTWLLPIAGMATIFRGLSSTSILVANRTLDLKWAVSIEFVAAVIGSLSMILIAAVTRSVIALAIGSIVTQVAYTWLSFQRQGAANRFHWDRDAVQSIVNFGRLSVFSSGIMIVQQRADRLAMGKLVSVGDLGSYVIGSNLALMPMIMFGRINAFILQPTYAKLREIPPSQARSKIRKLRLAIVLGHAPILMVLALFGQQIVDFMYPPNLHLAGWYCSLIALAALLRVSTDPGPVFPARGDAKTHLHITVVRTLAVILAMVVGYFLGDHYGYASNGMIYGLILAPLLSYPYEAYQYHRIRVWLPEVDAIGILMTLLLVAVVTTTVA